MLSLGPYVSVLRSSKLPVSTAERVVLMNRRADIEVTADAAADPSYLLEKSCSRNEYGYCDVVVRLTGWRSVADGRYGHLGISKRDFLVDRVLFASALPPSSITAASGN